MFVVNVVLFLIIKGNENFKTSKYRLTTYLTLIYSICTFLLFLYYYFIDFSIFYSFFSQFSLNIVFFISIFVEYFYFDLIVFSKTDYLFTHVVDNNVKSKTYTELKKEPDLNSDIVYDREEMRRYILIYAKKYNVSKEEIMAVVKRESLVYNNIEYLCGFVYNMENNRNKAIGERG
jgi:hypothetical protein